MRAAANGDKKLMRLLLKHGADISIRDAFGYNAERLAFSAGHYKVLATLRRHELRKSTASDDTRWSQRSSGVLAALNRRLSGNLKETKQQEDVSQFPTAVEPASQRSSTGLKPLRPYPCEFNDSSSH
ncbi:hypothetical protein PHMEG_0006570 [Phytophthora megakarya]|uniref:Uncharacterized protein n=1 Tax=Phytophthora megakarya TaxID=4795 RepID=A0A225WNN4_9STRA|nr:hypothetical protein PHMEG_0006570 [Phytophthora megakarya]